MCVVRCVVAVVGVARDGKVTSKKVEAMFQPVGVVVGLMGEVVWQN